MTISAARSGSRISAGKSALPKRSVSKLIRQIVASGGRKYTAGNIDRSKYDRLVDMGWLTPFKTNISDVEYQATDKGRAAAVTNGHD